MRAHFGWLCDFRLPLEIGLPVIGGGSSMGFCPVWGLRSALFLRASWRGQRALFGQGRDQPQPRLC